MQSQLLSIKPLSLSFLRYSHIFIVPSTAVTLKQGIFMPIKNGKALRVPANYKGMLREIEEVLTSSLPDETDEERRQKKLVKDKTNFTEIRKYFAEMSAHDNHFNKEGVADTVYIMKTIWNKQNEMANSFTTKELFYF